MTGAVTTPLDYEETARESPDIPDEYVSLAVNLIERTPGAAYTGKKPSGVFAAAVYAASIIKNDRLTQNTLSLTFDVSTGPIRETYKLFIKASNEHNIPDHAIDDLTSEELSELIDGCKSLDQYNREDLFTFVAQQHGWVNSNADGTISPAHSKYSGNAVTLDGEPSVSADPLKRFTSSLNLLNSFTTLVNEYDFNPETDLDIGITLTDTAYQELVLKAVPNVVSNMPLSDFRQLHHDELVEILARELGWELPGPNDEATQYFRPGDPPEITLSGIVSITEDPNVIEALTSLGDGNLEITEFTITKTGYVKLAEAHITDHAYILDSVEPGTVYANPTNTIIIVDAQVNQISATGTVTYAELTDHGPRSETTLPAFTFAETILEEYTRVDDEVVDTPHETISNFIDSVLTVTEHRDGSEHVSLDDPDRLEESLDDLSPVDLRVAHQLTGYTNQNE